MGLRVCCPRRTNRRRTLPCLFQSERVLEKRRLALRRKDDCEAKLRDIGTLPAAEVDKWESARKREVAARLAAVNEALKAYGAVNTKALEQHGEGGRGG